MQSGVPDFTLPVTDDDFSTHVALPPSVTAGNNDQTGIQAKGAVRNETSTPRTDDITFSAFPQDFNRHRLGGTDRLLINSDVQIHPGPGPRTKSDDLNSLAGTSGHIPDAISGVRKIVSQVGYRKPAKDIAEFPFQYSIDTINQIHQGLVPRGLQPRADKYTQELGADLLGQPASPISIPLPNKQVQANALQLISHLPDKFIQRNDGQLQTGETSADRSVMEIDRVRNSRQVYGRQIPDDQLQDPGATVISGTPPSSACQPPGRQVGYRSSPRQDDDNGLETYSVHVWEQLNPRSGLVEIKISRESFGPMFDQIPDGQLHSETATLTFNPLAPSVTQLAGEQIQNPRKRNFLMSDGQIHDHETEVKYTVTATLDNSPTTSVAPSLEYLGPLAPPAATRRREMQSMIDEVNPHVAGPVLCAALSSCLHAAPGLFRSPVQPSVSHRAEGAPSPNLGLGNPQKRRVAIASAQSQASVSMNGHPEWIAPAAAGPSRNRRSADDKLYQDLSAQTEPGSGRVKLVCFVWLLVFMLLGILEFL